MAHSRFATVEDPGNRWRRTIFIVVDSGLGIRNILRTDVLRTLREQKDLRVIVFSPIADREFRGEVEADNVVVEPLPDWNSGPIHAVLRWVKKDVWARKAHISTYDSIRARKPLRAVRSFVSRRVFRADSAEGATRALRRLERWENALTPLLAAEYYDRYRPDLVFYTTLYSRHHYLERGAQQRGIPTVAFVQSWDNPTSKGPFRLRPDHLIVWNEVLRDELIRYHGCHPEHLYVSGAPQFDIYADRKAYSSRGRFFRRWGLDPTRKLITYTTGTATTTPFDHEVVELLHAANERGAFRQPSQLLVRLHPKDRATDYRRFEGAPALVLQLPGRRGNTLDSWNPTEEDMYELAELMCYSDVVVNVASTITIDAAAFDTPVVNVAFDGRSAKPYSGSCRRYYDYDHYRRIVQSGGVRLAHSPEELVRHVQAYLDDPTLDADGRRIIREQQCGRLDGKAGRRIAGHLLALVERRRPRDRSLGPEAVEKGVRSVQGS